MGLDGHRSGQDLGYPWLRPIESLFAGFDARLQSAYGRARDTGSQPNRLTQAWLALAERTRLDQNGFATFVGWHPDRLFQRLAVYEDALTTLIALHGSCHLGVISNAWLHLERLLQLLNIHQYFESFVVSAQVGLRKPDAEIFTLGLRSFGVPAHEAIFVDDLPQNVLAAQQLGLTSLWVVRRPEKWSNLPAAYRDLQRISSLEQVVPLVKGA